MPGLKTALLTLWAPTRALSEAVGERRIFWPLILITLISVGFTGLTFPRTDFVRMAEDGLEKQPDSGKLTPHEREEKIDTAKKVAVVGATASALFWPALSVLLGAFFLWLGFKVAGGKPGFVGVFVVLAHAQLPGALKLLCTLPALFTRTDLAVDGAFQLLPSSLAALAPEGLPPGQLALLAAVELFTMWTLLITLLGMAQVAKVSRLRSSIVVIVLWASFTVVFRFALPLLSAAKG